jgi:hypothetical protein
MGLSMQNFKICRYLLIYSYTNQLLPKLANNNSYPIMIDFSTPKWVYREVTDKQFDYHAIAGFVRAKINLSRITKTSFRWKPS